MNQEFIRNNQQKLALVAGYLLVAGLAFGVGKYSSPQATENQIQQTSSPTNYSPNISGTQTADSPDCQGKIKGSSSLIYHVPGGAFYDKTTHPIRCFDTEAGAQSAGFRKSSR